MMDRREAVAILEDLADRSDKEYAHEDADGVLCDLLLSLGFHDVVEAYKKIGKWFS